MSDPVDSRPASGQPADDAGVNDANVNDAGVKTASPQFGLTSATALIVGSIIGVGIFNLPTSLAVYGPISLVSMALTTVGALALACCSPRCRGGCRPTAGRTPTRGPRSATRSGSPTPGPTGSPPGRATPRSPSAGSCTSRSSSTRATTRSVSVLLVLVGLWIPAAINLSGVKNMGIGPGRDDDREVRRAGVHGDGRPVLHQQPRTTRPGTSAARAPSPRSAAAWPSPCSATSASRPPPSRPPRCAIPTGTSPGPPSSARSPPPSSTCCRSPPCSASCPPRNSPTATAPFSDAANAMFGGTWAGNVMAIAVIISGFGALNGWTMICAEMPLAAAKDGLFPERFKRLSGTGVPDVRHRRLHRAGLGRDDHQLPRVQRRGRLHHPGADDRHHRRHPVRLLGARADQVAPGRPPHACRPPRFVRDMVVAVALAGVLHPVHLVLAQHRPAASGSTGRRSSWPASRCCSASRSTGHSAAR